MNVFELQKKLIDDYASYIKSFISIQDQRIQDKVDAIIDEELLWPTPRIALNPSFASSDRIDELVAKKGCDYDSPLFRWDEDRRFLLRCELDAAYFHLYGIAREDVDYIMETFPIVKRKDEAQHKEYRTKRVILECYNAMKQAMASGMPYQMRLNPPPADPKVAHLARESAKVVIAGNQEVS